MSRSALAALVSVAALHGVSWSATATPAAAKSTPAKKAAPKAPVKATPKATTAGVGNAPHSQIASRSAAAPAARVEWHAAPVKTETSEDASEGVSTPPATSAGTRVADVNAGLDTDKPAAVPQENPPALEVPVKPDTSEQPTPAPAPENNDLEGTPPATPVTPGTSGLPEGTAPVVLPEDNAIVPTDAEGREIASVRIFGNRVVTEDTILLAIKGVKPGAAFSVRQADLDRRNIRTLGFFAGVDYQVVPNLQDPNKVDVIFVVIENRVVTGYKFEGVSELQAADLEKVVVTQKGAVLSSPNVDEDVKKIQEAYRLQGFAALVTDVHQAEDGTVVYVVQEGKISKVEIEGLKKTRPSIVRSVILAKPGDSFNEQKIQKDLNRIYDLGFFEDVSYKIADDPAMPGALIVTIVLKERRTGSVTFGLGFDSRSKISGFGGISESNFHGTGKNVSAQVELGSQRSINLGFGDRFVGKNNASYQINVFDQTTFREPRSIERILGPGGGTGGTDTFSYEERRQGMRFNFTKPLDFERSRNILFGYRFEKIKLFLRDDEGDSVPVDLPEESTGRTSAFSIGFLRDKRDLKTDPSRGGRELLTIEEGLKALGGTSTFTKADLDVRRYFALIGAPKSKPGQARELPKLVFATRLVFGQTFGQLPAFEQYFIGGSDTVRGYDADEQYGDNQVYGNMEFRYRLQRKIQLVAFADAGSAYGGSFSSSDGIDPLFGVGIGARLTTPIGPVRLDIARGERGVKTHFGIGGTF